MTVRTKIFLLGLLSIGSLSYVLLHYFWEEKGEIEIHRSVRRDLAAVRVLSTAIHELQRERGETAGFLANPEPGNRGRLEAQRRATDEALEAAEQDASRAGATGSRLAAIRRQIDLLSLDPPTSRDRYTALIRRRLDALADIARVARDSEVKSHLTAHNHLLNAKDHLGEIRALLNGAFNAGVIEHRSIIDLARLRGIHEEALRLFRNGAPQEVTAIFDDRYGAPAVRRMLSVVDGVLAQGAGPTHFEPVGWFRDVSEVIDLLKRIENDCTALLENRIGALLAESEKSFAANSLFAAAAVLLIAAVTILVIRDIVGRLARLHEGVARVIATKDFSTTIPARPESRDEIRAIARGFNDLLVTADRLLKEQEHLATTDQLTGQANRGRFVEICGNEIRRIERNGQPLSLVMLDIDHFKRVNDFHGHLAGDSILAGLSALVAKAIRSTDLLARWGGEEFVLLLPDTAVPGAAEVAEKVRARIAEHSFPTVGRVTLSFGVAGYRPGDDLEILLKRADNALYEAKRTGRDRVCVEPMEAVA